MDITLTPKYDHALSPQELFGLTDKEVSLLLNGQTVRLEEAMKYDREHPVMYFTSNVISDTSYIITAICGASRIEYRWTFYDWRVRCYIASNTKTYAWGTEAGIIGEKLIDMYVDDRLTALRAVVSDNTDPTWYVPIYGDNAARWIKNRYKFALRAEVGKALMDSYHKNDLELASDRVDEYRLLRLLGLPNGYTMQHVEHFSPYFTTEKPVTFESIKAWYDGLTDRQKRCINHPRESLKTPLMTITLVRYLKHIAIGSKYYDDICRFTKVVLETNDSDRQRIADLYDGTKTVDNLEAITAVLNTIYDEIKDDAS